MPTSHRTDPGLCFLLGKNARDAGKYRPLPTICGCPNSHSIFRKIDGLPEDRIEKARPPETEAERKLARKLLFSIGDRTGSPGAETTFSAPIFLNWLRNSAPFTIWTR